jgi:manganese transport system ATP-binding protein
VEVRLGGRLALGASDFDIPTGAVTAVIGPNGSGKSTLLNVVAGLIADYRGELEVLDEPQHGTRSDVSYVLQATKVNDRIPMSVFEVVLMGRYAGKRWLDRTTPADRQAVSDVLRRLDLYDLRRRSLHELSGGQRQRVFVAQGLVQDHHLLLLDEPAVGLDLNSASTIERVIAEERSRGQTVVFSTHDLAQALAADHALLLAGRVVAAGPPSIALGHENLELAYGLRVVQAADGRYMVDDPAHAAVGRRHIHRVPGRG